MGIRYFHLLNLALNGFQEFSWLSTPFTFTHSFSHSLINSFNKYLNTSYTIVSMGNSFAKIPYLIDQWFSFLVVHCNQLGNF